MYTKVRRACCADLLGIGEASQAWLYVSSLGPRVTHQKVCLVASSVPHPTRSTAWSTLTAQVEGVRALVMQSWFNTPCGNTKMAGLTLPLDTDMPVACPHYILSSLFQTAFSLTSHDVGMVDMC
jgi:hypothetical protein